MNNPFQSLCSLPSKGKISYYSLAAFEKNTEKNIRRLPISIRIILESLIRNCDGEKVTEQDVLDLADWNPKKTSRNDIPFTVSRILLQDFTGVPLLVDLAAMRDAVSKQNMNSDLIEPMVPVDLVIDHSVQLDRSGTEDAFLFNLEIEFQRNRERYEFLKWGQEAFSKLRVVPPGIGIVHQVNLEYLATVVSCKETKEGIVAYPDTVLGTDSHTTMTGGLGILCWGVGGIEAEASMLGQPYRLQTPEVIGVLLKGFLKEGVTATDLTLTITQLLRKENVVGKFVEFFGDGVSSLTVADRSTIGNMAPEYGATIGFFPSDDKTLEYLELTGRTKEHIAFVKEYLTAQNLFGIPKEGEIDFSKVVTLDLGSVIPSVSGPKRPQDRLSLGDLKPSFEKILCLPKEKDGYGKEPSKKVSIRSDGTFNLAQHHITGGVSELESEKEMPTFSETEMVTNRPSTQGQISPGYINPPLSEYILDHGSVTIAAITSCTNTSNPAVMIAAGLLAKKACEKGLRVSPKVKTSLAPGSRAVTDYLEKSGLQCFLNKLGFHLAGYGCTTCIGNSGPLDEEIENAIKEHDLITASVLSGNRNFEARIHGAVKANFLMSPPLVVAFAIAGKVNVDLHKEPLGYGLEGKPVYLKDVWPKDAEIEATIKSCLNPEIFRKRYAHVDSDNPLWGKIAVTKSANYPWNPSSTYIRSPPFLSDFGMQPRTRPLLQKMRALAILPDSVTTDHISPAGAFKASSPAGEYLLSLGVKESSFNSYGSRRGNHDVMMRGTFANVRLRNKMSSREGGFTKLIPEGTEMSIFVASRTYMERKVPLILFAGKDYGMGSSRDWAAKGTSLLGVKVVVAKSFERIHRSNLVGMGVLPLEFKENTGPDELGITGEEEFSISGIENPTPGQEVFLEIISKAGVKKIPLLSRLDTKSDVDYYLNGGVLPYVLRKLLKPS